MVITDSIGDNKFECAFSFEVSHSHFAAAKFQKSVVKMQNYRDENRLTWAIFAWLSAMRCMQTDLVRGGASQWADDRKQNWASSSRSHDIGLKRPRHHETDRAIG
jgi:hypothetical protein